MKIDCRPKRPARHRIATANWFAFGVMILASARSYAEPTPPEIPFAGCSFFEHRDYEGHHFEVRGSRDVSWVGSAWNDQISSFSCSAGCVATVYEDRDFGGAYVSGAYLAYDAYWNDRISSMKVVCSQSGPFAGSVPTTPMGYDHCKPGFVWREANPTDHVCVTPGSRERVRRENAVASERVDPNGAWGPTSCISGFVWREAFDGDHVCVTPHTRDVVRIENELGPSRTEGATNSQRPHGPLTTLPTDRMHYVRCKPGFVPRNAGAEDQACAPPEARARVQAENREAPSRIDPNGASGPLSCIPGFIWREAFLGDRACVAPEARDLAWQENKLSNSRSER